MKKKYLDYLFAILIIMNIACKNTNEKYTVIKESDIPKIGNYYSADCDSIVKKFADDCFIRLFGEKRFSLIHKNHSIGVTLKFNLDGIIKKAKIFKNTNLTEKEAEVFTTFLLTQKLSMPCTNDYLLRNKSRDDLEKMKNEKEEEFCFEWGVYIYNQKQESF